MSIGVYERVTSRKRTLEAESASVDLDFIAIGSTNDALIYAALLALTPKRYTVLGPVGLPLVLRRNKIEHTPAGGGLWDAKVNYGFQLATADDESDDDTNDNDVDPVGPEFSFDTTGGTEHITQSLATISSAMVGGGAAPDYKRAIGVSRDGVAGCDKIASKCEFTLTLQKVGLTRPYFRTLAYNTGRVNSAAWWGYQAGEVLFLGAAANAKPGTRFTLTYKFAVQENRSNVVIGGLQITTTRATGSTTVTLSSTTGIVVGMSVYGTGIPPGTTVATIVSGTQLTLSAAATSTGTEDVQYAGTTSLVFPSKKGWEYLWCAYKDDTSANMMIQVPVAGYVEQIYRTCNLTAVLGF